MAAANIGSAKASMRRHAVPIPMISPTGVMTDISSGAKIHISTPISVMTVMPSAADIHAKERVRAFLPAPKLWPTSVVAASAMPKPGM